MLRGRIPCEADGVVRQVVRVQCPGVRQEDIEADLHEDIDMISYYM